MAVITSNTVASAAGVVTLTTATATASDTLTYVANSGQLLELHNSTAGNLSVVIKGSAPSNAYPSGAGVGGLTSDLSAGLTVAVAAGVRKIVNLDKISAYLAGNGTVTLSGASGLTLTLIA